MTNQPTNHIDDLGVVIAAGGSSRRYGSSNKLLERLNGVPVFVHSLRRFSGLCRPGALLLVVPEADQTEFARLVREYCPTVNLQIITGGTTRCHSVYNGLCALPDFVNYAAIHDAARPFASVTLLQRCLEAARQYGGALAAHPVTDTLKSGSPEGLITATVDRSKIWAVETPQIFALTPLRQAYENALATGTEFTDDAGVMEQAGYRVKLVDNPDNNLKITYSRDLSLAEALISLSADLSW